MRLSLICLLLSVSLQVSFGQQPTAQPFKSHDLSTSSSNLFVHFDKNVYSNNETIWFTGYLIKQSQITFSKHRVLAVSLIRDIDTTLVCQDKFLIQNGISFGSMTIPDSLLTGNYHLLATTDLLVNGKPDALFLQPITIKTNIESSFKASMKIIKVADLQQNINQILLSVTSKEGTFLPKPTVVNYSYGNSYKTGKTDASGQLLISLPVQNNLANPNLQVKLMYQKDTSFISIPLPPLKQQANVKFYPEGGNLVNGLASKIGWEVKDQQQMPLATTAFLYTNDKLTDTIATNSYGLGTFTLIPEKGANYTVCLQNSNLVDSVYQLPLALEKGMVLSMQNAVVGDSLQLNLRTNDTRKLTIRIHNFKEVYMDFPFDMEYHKRSIKIPLSEIPKGLTTITISDSTGKPLTERMFFAHYPSTGKINIQTNQSTYKQREKVNLKLNLSASQQQAMVSIACVQENRMELGKMTDIESYSYLNKELTSLPTHLKGNPYADEQYLEQVILIKGWRRYSWDENPQLTTMETGVSIDSLRITGKVTKSDKELIKPVLISALGSTNINLINTSSAGFFSLQNEQILTATNKPIYLFINKSKPSELFEFKINDPYLSLARETVKTVALAQPILRPAPSDNTQLLLKNDEKSLRLKEVKIVANKDNSFNFTKGMPGRNACGDYVCLYNILNCGNHMSDFGNTQPIAGKYYQTNGMSIVYAGCTTTKETNNIGKIKGIHVHKEFYVDDYKEPAEPAFFSTLYWNYATLINTDKETELSFYTSDITGRFKIIVQGITNKDVIYAEHFFEVKK